MRGNIDLKQADKLFQRNSIKMPTKTEESQRNCCELTQSEKIPDTGMCLNPDECATAMMTLTDSNRLRIIRALLVSRRNVGEIAKITGLNIHRVSHHLGIMRLVGLVEPSRQGRNIVYNINPRILTKHGVDLGCLYITFRGL
jgi:DNA-binding transcriptional ArsR family regulator